MIDVFVHSHEMVVVAGIEAGYKTPTHATPESPLLANIASKEQVNLNTPERNDKSGMHGMTEVKDGWHMGRSARKVTDVDTQVRRE